MNDEDSAISGVGGFILGVVLTAIFVSLFIREEVDDVNMNAINSAISKCPNGEYNYINVDAKIAAYGHWRTHILCKDGSRVTTYVEEKDE